MRMPATESSAGGFAVRSAPFVAPRDRGVVPLPRLVAAPAGSIRGVVRDASGQPAVGVPVEVRGAGEVRSVATGAGGAFAISGLLPDEYVVEPFAHRGEVGVAAEVRVQQVDHRPEVTSLFDVDLEQVAAVIHARRAGAEQTLLLDTGRLGVRLDDDDALERMTMLPGHLLPHGFAGVVSCWNHPPIFWIV